MKLEKYKRILKEFIEILPREQKRVELFKYIEEDEKRRLSKNVNES